MARSRPSRAAFGAWLKEARLSQERFGEALGIAQQTVSGLLVGREPSEELAKLIEVATGIDWRGWFTNHQLQQFARREIERKTRLERASGLRALVPTGNTVVTP